MEITMTAGARYFPQFGTLAAPNEVWSERVLTAPSDACRLRAGRLFQHLFQHLFHGVFYGAQVNPIGIDLPVTDRMRRSASEP